MLLSYWGIIMINPVSLGSVKTSIFYINDFHGKTLNMERAFAASKTFDNKQENNNDILKLSAGDIMLGEDINTNNAAIMFQNFLKIDASAIGNHEQDIQDKADKVLPLIKYNILSNNIKIHPRSPWYGRVKASIIEEKNGHKYGIIGSTPIDLYKRSKQGVLQRDISVHNAKETLNDIQTEINELKKQGINKIILLSHLGYTLDKLVAQNTKGLDVIIGGHSHELIYDVKKDKNLFFNLDKEPVVITQAGRDGKNFGILNIEFDNNGIIKKVQNNIGQTKDFHRDMAIRHIFDKILGNNQKFGYINSAPSPNANDLIDKNPHAYFIADCIKKDLNCDIAIVPAANLRGFFEKGKLDDRILSDIMPFKNKLQKMNYSEKDIVDAIKHAAKSYIQTANKPGILYTSGLKYSISNKGELLSMSFIDRNGKEQPIDINNPRTDKFYTTVINDYCAEGNDGFKMLYHPENIIKKYTFDGTQCVKNIVMKTSKPIDIKDDGRLEIIEK